jgi:hypothetical protein
MVLSPLRNSVIPFLLSQSCRSRSLQEMSPVLVSFDLWAGGISWVAFNLNSEFLSIEIPLALLKKLYAGLWIYSSRGRFLICVSPCSWLIHKAEARSIIYVLVPMLDIPPDSRQSSYGTFRDSSLILLIPSPIFVLLASPSQRCLFSWKAQGFRFESQSCAKLSSLKFCSVRWVLSKREIIRNISKSCCDFP